MAGAFSGKRSDERTPELGAGVYPDLEIVEARFFQGKTPKDGGDKVFFDVIVRAEPSPVECEAKFSALRTTPTKVGDMATIKIKLADGYGYGLRDMDTIGGLILGRDATEADHEAACSETQTYTGARISAKVTPMETTNGYKKLVTRDYALAEGAEPRPAAPTAPAAPSAPAAPAAKLTAEDLGWTQHPDSAVHVYAGAEVVTRTDVENGQTRPS